MQILGIYVKLNLYHILIRLAEMLVPLVVHLRHHLLKQPSRRCLMVCYSFPCRNTQRLKSSLHFDGFKPWQVGSSN